MTHSADSISRANVRLEKALQSLEDGFTTKAAQKDANDHLNRAYNELRDIIHRTACNRANLMDPDRKDPEAWFKAVDEFDMPFDLHNLRDRHIAKACELHKDVADKMEVLVDARALVKAEPIQKVQPKNVKSEFEVKAEKTIAEEMERLQTQYLRAVELGHIFNGIPVSANSHWVVNQYGTGFVRTFYYLEGKLTRLNVIIAAAQKVAREKSGK